MLNKRIVEMLTEEYKRYPQAQFIDFFKIIFQACYGPGHAINDIDAARDYYLNEFNSVRTDSEKKECLIHDLSYPNGFYRVHLTAVEKGLVGKDELFNGFVQSSCIICDTCRFVQLWDEADAFITREMGIDKDDKSLIAISTFFSDGRFPSHSSIYRAIYSPHYRLIHKKFIPEKLLKKL